MGAFVDYLLRTEHMLIMLGVWVGLTLAQRMLPRLAENRHWARALPAVPVLACSVAVWLPGLVDGSPAERVLLGLILGSFSGHAHKLLKQSVFGNDKRIRDHPPRL